MTKRKSTLGAEQAFEEYETAVREALAAGCDPETMREALDEAIDAHEEAE
jgi:hypothetical protein